MKKSFSLLGVLISIQILVVAIVAIIGLMSATVINSRTAGNRLAAMELAQEGIEKTRNIRDKNWLVGDAWRTGMADGNYQVKYDQPNLIALTSTNKKMKYDSNFWFVPAGTSTGETDTIFERTITLSSGGADKMIVKCEVAWAERGKSYNIELEDWLYNWR